MDAVELLLWTHSVRFIYMLVEAILGCDIVTGSFFGTANKILLLLLFFTQMTPEIESNN